MRRQWISASGPHAGTDSVPCGLALSPPHEAQATPVNDSATEVDRATPGEWCDQSIRATSEVVREALRLLKRDQAREQLRADVQAGSDQLVVARGGVRQDPGVDSLRSGSKPIDRNRAHLRVLVRHTIQSL